MSYDFDKLNNRRNTHSMKWDIKDNELPLWVADMDFETAPVVKEALARRVEHGIYGYTIVEEEWEQAIINWWDRRHNYRMDPQWLIFCTGVVPAISTAVQRLTNVGDRIVVQTPVYSVFFNSIENHGRHPIENHLIYEEGKYHIDFHSLEEQLSHPQTRMMILCNPHNPIGQIWTREELEHIGQLCAKHHVIVLSDEIHCDLTNPECAYIPFASVSEICQQNSVTCLSASKAFNLAGLQSAAVSVPNDSIRAVLSRGLNSNEVAEPNAFAIDGVIAAFNEGEPWLNDLRAYIKENKKMVNLFLKDRLPELKLHNPEATYLLWIDCSELTQNASELQNFLREETGLYVSSGAEFRGNGHLFLRMNVACPASRVREALKRLEIGVQAYKKNK